MAGIQLTGLASGFDWKSVVDQLMELQQVPKTRLQTQQTTNTSKLSVFSSLRTQLSSLQTSVQALSGDSLFSQRVVDYSNEDLGWSASVADGTAAGDYKINVSKLATRAVRSGGSDIASTLSASSDVSGAVLSELRLGTAVTEGTFTVNGSQVDIETTDTLQDVFDKISTATGGAVTASYDSGTDRVTLSSSSEITLGSAIDSSNFLGAFKLYNNGTDTITSSTDLGTISLDDTLDAAGLRDAITAVDGSGNGSFSINGVSIDFNVNDDSIRSIITRVNNSGAGVSMGYDAVNDRFSLTNATTGDVGIAVSESAGGLLSALGLTSASTFTRGTNAEFSVNDGGTIISASNVLDGSSHGITGLSVTATSLGEQTLTVSGDKSALDTGIRDFITKYNSVQSYIDNITKVSTSADGTVTAALMSNNRELTSLASDLRNKVFDSVSGLSGTIQRLANIGIDFEDSSSQLAVRDEAAFANAIENNSSDVASLFSSSTTGLSDRLDSYITQITQTNGLIDVQETTLERQNRSLDTQIADVERRLEAERTRLEESFIRMEDMQSRLNSQLAAMQQTLGISG